MRKTKRPIIVGTGLIALDVVLRANSDKPIAEAIGGTCGNVLSILSFLGWDALPVARLGNDPAAKKIISEFGAMGVSTQYLKCRPAAPAPIIIERLIEKQGEGQHRFSMRCPRCKAWLPGYRPVTLQAVRPIGEAMGGVAGYFFDRVSASTLHLAAAAADKGGVVMFEPSSMPDPASLNKALQHAHIVKYAADRLDGLEAFERSDSVVLEVKTSGGKGAFFRERLSSAGGGWIEQPAYPVKPLKDPCGSGDWFSAGVLDRLARRGRAGLNALGREDVREAVRFAQALAARNCSFEGARGGMRLGTRRSVIAEAAKVMAHAFEPRDKPQPESRNRFKCPSCP